MIEKRRGQSGSNVINIADARAKSPVISMEDIRSTQDADLLRKAIKPSKFRVPKGTILAGVYKFYVGLNAFSNPHVPEDVTMEGLRSKDPIVNRSALSSEAVSADALMFAVRNSVQVELAASHSNATEEVLMAALDSKSVAGRKSAAQSRNATPLIALKALSDRSWIVRSAAVGRVDFEFLINRGLYVFMLDPESLPDVLMGELAKAGRLLQIQDTLREENFGENTILVMMQAAFKNAYRLP